MLSLARAFGRILGRGSPSEPSAGELASRVAVTPSLLRWDGIIEAADDGLLACDATATLVLVNPTAAALLGIEPLKLEAATDWPRAALPLKSLMQRALEVGYAVDEMQVERAWGERLLEARATRVLSEGGVITGAVLVLRDITRTADATLAPNRDWAALAHDLKTPLNSIGGFSTLLLQETVGPINPLQRDFLKTIQHETERLTHAVQGLLEEARTSHAENSQGIGVSILELVEQAIERVGGLAAGKSLLLRLEAPDSLPSVQVDPEKISVVLINLLDNAISFSGEGTEIVVDARQVEDTVEISVTDQGVGIPNQSAPLIFDRFYRAPNQPSSGRPGVGLGLSVSREIVERHGGRIWADDQSRTGARLVFSLPIAAADSPQALMAPR